MRRRLAVAGGIAAAGTAGALAGGALGAGTYFARKVLTPDPRRPDDVVVLAVDEVGGGATVTLGLSADTSVDGRYGLWLDGGAGHARIGDVLAVDEAARTVTRRVLGVDRGTLEPGTARWNQYFFGGPPQESLGLPTEQVLVPTEIGEQPAWLVPGRVGAPYEGGWAVLVHGRGARPEECLRAVPVLHDLGLTSLVITYRNDPGAPPSPDGRYSLGLSEWRDLEAAMLYAVERGAGDLTLFGCSMGGAIVLQALDRSWLAERVSQVVLDAPVVDWADVLRHHGQVNHLPGPVAFVARSLIGRRWARRLVGVHEPIDVASTNWDDRADELRHPMLLIHSVDDEFVPSGPSAALAAKRPDLVRFEPWTAARHTKEWNVDPQRWETVVREFLSARPDRAGLAG